jgi:hypothetical protein
MNYADIFAAGSLVWPLTFLLAFLLLLRRAGERLDPIFGGIVDGVAKNAGSNAVAYAIAIGFGFSASISAFIEVFSQMDKEAFKALSWHQYFVQWCKVANPFIVAVLAYATQNKFVTKTPGSTQTTPPIPLAT